MAEKPEEQFTSEEKIAKAKELYARGCRNYYVKAYSEAADDLSEATQLYAEEYGVDGDDVGEVYLLYAKALIAMGQGENKLIEVPESDDDDEPEDAEPEVPSDSGNEDKAETNGTAGTTNGEKTNGHCEEPQAGPSGINEAEESSNEAQDVETEDGNLEVAWEVLQNAALIFERQGAKGGMQLMEVYNEMAGISLENGNFDVAINDYGRAKDVFMDLEEHEQNQRILAEIYYKIGLCQSTTKEYDEAVKSFQQAADIFDDLIGIQKAIDPQTDATAAEIKDLEDTQQEIINKITEIGETKAEETELVKTELKKLLGPSYDAAPSSDGAGSSTAEGGSSSKKPAEADKKPTDISHLIKRKKVDNDVTDESPAKKQAVETSPGKPIAAAAEATAEKVPEETAVPLIEN